MPDYPSELDADPYKDANRPLVALLIPTAPKWDNVQVDTLRRFIEFGKDLWKTARSVLVYWTPERLELEALRRAADHSGATVLAQEVAIFTAVYQHWLDFVVNYPYPNNTEGSQLSNVRETLSETLQTLERRATVIEARATDLRLRGEFEALRRELGGRELAGGIKEAILEALKNPESEDHLRAVALKLDHIEKRFPALEQMAKDVDFIADRVTADLVQRELKPLPEKAARGLAKVAAGAVTKVVLLHLANLWLSR